MIRHLLPLLLLPLLSGCFLSHSRRHEPLSPDALSSLRPGTATAGEVVEALGAPNEVVQLGRRYAYRYDHAVEKQTGLFLLVLGLRRVDTQEDRAWLFFDETGVLTHVGATFEASTAAYGMPGS